MKIGEQALIIDVPSSSSSGYLGQQRWAARRRLVPFLIGPGLFFIVLALHAAVSDQPFSAWAEGVLELLTKDGVPLALIAIGAGVVIASGAVDLSAAGVATLSGVVFALCSTHMPDLTAMAISVATGAVSGTLLGWCRASGISPLLSSWAIGTLAVIAALLLAKYLPGTIDGVRLDDGVWTSFRLKHGAFFVSLTAFALLLIILLLLNIPSHARCIGSSLDAATYIGIPVRRTMYWSFIAAGVFSATAGTLWARADNSARTTDHLGYELVGIAVAALGGTLLSGGYLNIGSIIATAFFWILLDRVLVAANIPLIGADDHSIVSTSIFAMLVLISLFVTSKFVTPSTHAESVARRINDGKNN